MSEATFQLKRATGPHLPTAVDLSRWVVRLAALAVVDAFAIWLLYRLLSDAIWPLAVALALVTLLVNVINLSDRLYPLQWMSPALWIIILLVLYPIIFTVYTAFTNYGDGHLLSKTQSIHRLGQEQFVPEGGASYSWTAYRSPEDEIILWLVGEDGQTYLARTGQPLEEAVSGEDGIGPLDESGAPETIEGYTRLGLADILPILDSQLAGMEFGQAPQAVRIRTVREAAPLLPRYVYDETADAITDQTTGVIYYADDETGYFTSEAGRSLSPGYQVEVGWRNFARLLNSPALRGPFLQVFAWTVSFAVLSVVTTFALGLLLAVLLNSPNVPARKLFRTLLILPYGIPGIISVLIWRGMLNPHLGVISANMIDLIGWAPGWFTDEWWSKIGILLVNLWLGYPYMMLVCSGALQSIPNDIYEAAAIDGAGGWQKFWKITLPLLLVSVGPLLVASFTFNFNNFTVIYAFNEGLPPIPNTPTPAGHTDILITYAFRLAFESGRGADYGYAAAITIVIFIMVALATLFQYRFVARWEEISENV